MKRRANLEQQKTQVLLAQQQLDRARFLVPKGFETKEVLDQRQQQLDGAIAAQNAAIAKIDEAEFALDAATHDVQLYQIDIADNSLVAPRDGRIQYRVANVGRGAARRRQGLHHPRHRLCLYGHLPADAGRRPGQARLRGADRSRRLSDPADPGRGDVHCLAGAVHPEGRRDQGRARQAHVPDPGADRSRTVGDPRGRGQKRPAGRCLCAHRSSGRLAAQLQADAAK